ncbi:unnamed protein product [Rhizophagus irregularis]|uniref:BED-type domain-containing protein n=1 Tax=Rhizophagus irregularis TaxID=588596 RepID=A0A916E7F0_9GLOM|nr:unnamed protein product [Rhizophagus irregularis]
MNTESNILTDTDTTLNDNLDYSNILDDTSTILDDIENETLNLIQKKSGKRRDKVWDYFDIVDIPNDTHKGAVCKFCKQSWKRGKPNEMKSHLALRCSKVPHNIKIEYLRMISNEEVSEQSISKINKTDNSGNIDFTRADKSLVRFFICCGIPFSVVDSPFFQDFVKKSANVILKIEEELRQSKNLTLGVDSWTSPLGQSIYAFVIITPTRRQYIYSINDFSSQRHTAEFNEEKMLKVIENIFSEQPDIFINATKTKAIIQDRQFWYNVEQLKLILKPAKSAIKALEFNTTTLADCFFELLKMARTISEIPSFQNIDFKKKCIAIFNKRWKEFDINTYMVAFLLHPKYRASCFQQKIFKKISREAINIWKDQFGGGKDSSNLLLTQLNLYRDREDPFDDSYTEGISNPINWWTSVELKKGEDPIRKLALKMHGIMPHNADCERVFSILGWYLSKRRTKINIDRLQAMAQVHSYLLMNAKSELKFLDDEITSEELDETLNQIVSSINNGVDLFDDDSDNNNLEIDLVFEDINEIEETVNLEDVNNYELEVSNFINLSTSILNDKDDDTGNNKGDEESIMHHGDLSFDVDELIDKFELIQS